MSLTKFLNGENRSNQKTMNRKYLIIAFVFAIRLKLQKKSWIKQKRDIDLAHLNTNLAYCMAKNHK